MTEPSSDQHLAAGDIAETERGAADRLTFFSDAVVAIAMTLLAIDLEVPEGDTVQELLTSVGANWDGYLTFLISFAVIARHWIGHHRVFRYVARASTALTWLNMLWLLLIVLTPFLTRILDDHLDTARFALYAVAQALQIGVFALMNVVLNRGKAFLPGTPRALTHRGWANTTLTAVGFLVAIPFFPLIGAWAFAFWGLVPAIGGRIMSATGFAEN